MAVPFKIRVCKLFAKLLAHTQGIFGMFPAAGAVASGALQPLTDKCYHTAVFIHQNFHVASTLLQLFLQQFSAIPLRITAMPKIAAAITHGYAPAKPVCEICRIRMPV